MTSTNGRNSEDGDDRRGPLPDEEQREVVRQASHILALARRTRCGSHAEGVLRWRQIGAEVEAISQRYGSAGLEILFYGLADTLALHQWNGAPAGPGQMVSPLWMDPSGEVYDNADDVPPPFRWVGRFVTARAARDRETCEALLTSCSPDDFPVTVIALIDATAATLNLIHGVPEPKANEQ